MSDKFSSWINLDQNPTCLPANCNLVEIACEEETYIKIGFYSSVSKQWCSVRGGIPLNKVYAWRRLTALPPRRTYDRVIFLTKQQQKQLPIKESK